MSSTPILIILITFHHHHFSYFPHRRVLLSPFYDTISLSFLSYVYPFLVYSTSFSTPSNSHYHFTAQPLLLSSRHLHPTPHNSYHSCSPPEIFFFYSHTLRITISQSHYCTSTCTKLWQSIFLASNSMHLLIYILLIHSRLQPKLPQWDQLHTATTHNNSSLLQNNRIWCNTPTRLYEHVHAKPSMQSTTCNNVFQHPTTHLCTVLCLPISHIFHITTSTVLIS